MLVEIFALQKTYLLSYPPETLSLFMRFTHTDSIKFFIYTILFCLLFFGYNKAS